MAEMPVAPERQLLAVEGGHGWWRRINRDDLWLSVIRDIQRHVRRGVGCDVVALWAQLPPRGFWLRVMGQLRQEFLLPPEATPFRELALDGRPRRVETASLKGPYQRVLRRTRVHSAWVLPLRPPQQMGEARQWMGALGLGWYGPAPEDLGGRELLASALWFLLGQRVEDAYIESVLEAASGWGGPAREADWEVRMASMASRLGGDHWTLYRLVRGPQGPADLRSLAEWGSAMGRGARLEAYMAQHPQEVGRSALAQAMTQERGVFIEDLRRTAFYVPGELAPDPVRSAAVLPLGSRDGREYALLAVYWNEPRGWERFGLSVRPWDAFRRVAAEWWQHMKTAHDARHDPLTGLYNRHGMAQAWSQVVAGRPMGLLGIVDVDRFAEVNNRWGHLMGDEVLRELARLLQAAGETRGGCVGRWGGDEFVLCLPGGVSWAELGREVQRGLEEAAHRHHWPGAVTVSGGAAAWRRSRPSWDAVFARADRRLYRAKQLGRAQFLGG